MWHAQSGNHKFQLFWFQLQVKELFLNFSLLLCYWLLFICCVYFFQRIAECLNMSKKKVKNATEVPNAYDLLLLCYLLLFFHTCVLTMSQCVRRQSVKYSHLIGRHSPLWMVFQEKLIIVYVWLLNLNVFKFTYKRIFGHPSYIFQHSFLTFSFWIFSVHCR